MKQNKITLHEIGHIQGDRLFILVMFLGMEVWDDLYSMLYGHREFFSFLLWKYHIHTKVKCTLEPRIPSSRCLFTSSRFFFYCLLHLGIVLKQEDPWVEQKLFPWSSMTLLGQKRERREKKMCLGALTHGGEGQRWASLAYQPSLHSASGLRRVLPGSSSQTVILTLPLGGPGLLGAP